MRNSGVHWFHVWRIFPQDADANGKVTFTAQIDGEDAGTLKSENMQAAIQEVKELIEQMMKAGQR